MGLQPLTACVTVAVLLTASDASRAVSRVSAFDSGALNDTTHVLFASTLAVLGGFFIYCGARHRRLRGTLSCAGVGFIAATSGYLLLALSQPVAIASIGAMVAGVGFAIAALAGTRASRLKMNIDAGIFDR